ncbi:hypothetical protein FM114_04720 [Luteococcus japonicus LSP_Lj1]|uniref:Uncharacterized protein n=1 Tax=Luteococcus japonicus LSP_Lj1 TaxID=1255658 RepID=A0A1R4J0C5_9ACTN|nr:hypothetical protein FM114_04720 [Luteococcus japonicus LSP_Lj1]
MRHGSSSSSPGGRAGTLPRNSPPRGAEPRAGRQPSTRPRDGPPRLRAAP